MYPESGFLNDSYVTKMTVTSQLSILLNFFDIILFSFSFIVEFSYCYKFHYNIITGSGVMKICFYKGLARNTEIENTPVWVLTNILRPGQVNNIKLGTNISDKILLNAEKCQGYIFYCFWVIMGQSTGAVKLPTPHLD